MSNPRERRSCGGEWEIVRYSPADARLWDDFVRTSRNATFLFMRGFMDYHSDRFADHSLLARRNGKLAAILPANVRDDTLHSHQGLTYGGWLLPERHFDGSMMECLFAEWTEYCRAEGFRQIKYKPLPAIYATRPSDEDLYWLWQRGAEVAECNLSCAIDLQSNPGFNTLQRRNLRKALALRPELRRLQPEETALFHSMLSGCLAERHGAVPVHTEAELRLLGSRFPEEIGIYGAFAEGILQAGVMIFDSRRVRHCQYIATTPQGRANGLLTLLMSWLIERTLPGQRYFDFGISNEQHGRVLNPGLYRQKASLGGSGIIYQTLSLSL